MEVTNLDGDQISEAEGPGTDEAQVDAEIVQLWSAQQDRAAAASKTRDELKALRRDLADRLHAMKTLLVQT
jgi:hypothetical protein